MDVETGKAFNEADQVHIGVYHYLAFMLCSAICLLLVMLLGVEMSVQCVMCYRSFVVVAELGVPLPTVSMQRLQ